MPCSLGESMQVCASLPKRTTGVEPATFGLGSRRSATCLRRALDAQWPCLSLRTTRGDAEESTDLNCSAITLVIMILRCTGRFLDLLGRRGVTLVDDPPSGEDWYANLMWIDRRKCLLLTHAGTLFPVFAADVRKPDLRPPGPFIVAQIRAALADERLPPSALGELDADNVRLAQTASRSVLGFMNDSALACRYSVEHAGGLALTDLDDLNRSLRRQLHNRDDYHQPLDLVLEHLSAG